jgi:SAM-dependent methyltransferase
MSDSNVVKRLASLAELNSRFHKSFMDSLNQIAHQAGLEEYTTYSRFWEYPWLWTQLEPLKKCGLRVLDIGSERSPFPWFLATQGFDIIVSDISANNWGVWERAGRHLGINVCKRILDTQDLDLPTASVDVYLSISVIEHVPDKQRSITEAARVLRPNGLMIMTFDLCEPEMGMTFPEWNGQALTMREFDELFRNIPWFKPGLSELPWNVDDIPDYLGWHRTTAPHHNYVTGAVAVHRNGLVWQESRRLSLIRFMRSTTCGIFRRLLYTSMLPVVRLCKRFPFWSAARRVGCVLRHLS